MLDQKLLPLAGAAQPLQVRLNGAIALSRVAAKVNNGALKNSAIAFTLDNAEPVALWGVKAGKYLVPQLLQVGQAGTLNAAIITAMAKFKNNPAILEDAYDDFTGDQILGGSGAAAAPERTFR